MTSSGGTGHAAGDPERRAVLHITQPVTEGVGNYVRFLATRQMDLGYRVGLACVPSSELADEAIGAGVDLHRFEAGREPSLAIGSEIRQLVLAIRAFRPEVVHLHSSKAGMAGRLAIRGRYTTIFQPHAWSFEAADGVMGLTALRWERFATRWADAIVTVSDGERELAARNGIETEGDTTIFNPVDTDHFRPAVGRERETLRAELGLGDGPIVLCVGRLCRQKGQDLLLDAWDAVHQAVPPARLLLAGDGPTRAQLEARQTPNTTFLGDRDDIPSLLRIADVVALPSRWEGMSLAMLEAMSSGRSVVASDVGGATETIGAGAGAVVSVGVKEQLAEALIRRLTDRELAEAEGRRGRDLAAERHSLGTTLAAVDEMYERVLQQQRASGRLPVASERG